MKQGFRKLYSILIVGLLMAVLVLSRPQEIWAEEKDEPPPADLTELSIEELMNVTVYGASKFPQKMSEAPSSVTIITSDEIKKYGYRTLADILRSVRGFFVTYDRDYSYVGVRGFNRPSDYNNRILLIVDGHRTNENVYNQAMIGTEFILDTDLIDRVEVIRGPGSSLYGNNAFFAVINVITKRGKDVKGTEASGDAGSFSTYKGRISYGDQYQNGLEAIVSGTGYDSTGDRLYFKEYDSAYSADPRAIPGGMTSHTDYGRFQSFFTKVSHQDVTFEGAYSSRTKGVPTGAYLTDINDPTNRTVDIRSYADMKYEHSLGKRTDLSARLFYDYYQYLGYYPGDTIYGVLNKSLTNGEWWGSEAKLTSTLFDAHRVIIGAEYTDNIRQDHKNYDVDPYVSYSDTERKSEILAAYFQDEFSPAKNLIVNAGARYDYYSTFGSTFNPRFALIYKPVEKSAIKLLYGTAFRAPNDYEMYYTNIIDMENTNLKPEKINTYELVYEQYIGDRFRMTATGYYYKISDLIANIETAPGSGITVFKNVNEVDAKGLELELETKWGNGIDGRISYTIQRTEDDQTGEPLTNSPAQLAKLNLTVPLLSHKFFASIEEQYMSRRKTQAGEYTEGFFITNLTLFSRNIKDRLELSASLYNLFDKQYSDPGMEEQNPPYSVLDTIEQDGRTYRVKLTYIF